MGVTRGVRADDPATARSPTPRLSRPTASIGWRVSARRHPIASQAMYRYNTLSMIHPATKSAPLVDTALARPGGPSAAAGQGRTRRNDGEEPTRTPPSAGSLSSASPRAMRIFRTGGRDPRGAVQSLSVTVTHSTPARWSPAQPQRQTPACSARLLENLVGRGARPHHRPGWKPGGSSTGGWAHAHAGFPESVEAFEPAELSPVDVRRMADLARQYRERAARHRGHLRRSPSPNGWVSGR